MAFLVNEQKQRHGKQIEKCSNNKPKKLKKGIGRRRRVSRAEEGKMEKRFYIEKSVEIVCICQIVCRQRVEFF